MANMRMVKQIPLAQQPEPMLGEIQMSSRSLRKQPRPVPPQPDFSQDISTLQDTSYAENHNNVLSFHRSSSFHERQA